MNTSSILFVKYTNSVLIVMYTSSILFVSKALVTQARWVTLICKRPSIGKATVTIDALPASSR